MTNTFHSEQAPPPVGSYPHAKKVGNLLFLSGIGPRMPLDNSIPGLVLNDAGEIISYDIAQQCHQVFMNINAVLKSCDAKWEQLVDVTVFLTNMKQDFPIFNDIYAKYFNHHQPCRTTVEVNSLPTQIAIELKCIACLD